MAGSITITERIVGSVKEIKAEWTSDASSPSTEDASDTTEFTYDGKVIRAVFENTSSPPATAGYDVAVTDENGHDVLHGLGANRYATSPPVNPELVDESDGLGSVAGQKLTVSITNAGPGATGTVILHIR